MPENTIDGDSTPRWGSHLIGRHDGRYGFEFGELIMAGSQNRDASLFVMGLGYDPRTTHALSAVAPLLAEGSKVLAIVPRPSVAGGTEADLQAQNAENAHAICESFGLEFVQIDPPHVQDVRRLGVRLSRDLQARPEWQERHVVLDVSGLPSPISFALVRAWIEDASANDRNLQVVATENSMLDDVIEDAGTGDPILLPGLEFDRDIESVARHESAPRVWTPVLGRGKRPQLEAILAKIRPDEVLPVIPFPGPDPRRGDSLLGEYFDFFESAEFDPRSVIHADAENPFDLYRALTKLNRRYREALEPLGEAIILPSVHGSKLLGIGVLLASIENEMPVVTAGAQRSRIGAAAEGLNLTELVQQHSQLTCLWLTGDPFK